MENREIYQALANQLDSFPQGFPASKTGKELDVLAHLFSPEEARLASHLTLEFQSFDEIIDALNITSSQGRALIKGLSQKGLIYLMRGSDGLELLLLPFIVGFYENQRDTIDETFAQLFEDYYQEVAHELLSVEPQFHRVIPVNETIDFNIEILPEESVSSLLSEKQAWAVMDCICRKQKALLGEGCDHPLKMCLVMSDTPGVFDGRQGMDALDLEGAIAVLDEAARAGLVHTVSNQKKDISYICNCCTCSCGLLRGIAEANVANVVAKSSYFATVTDELCVGCGECIEVCQFDAITLDDIASINRDACVGCGVCARNCPEGAITLSLRDPLELTAVPDSLGDWLEQRAGARGIVSTG
jgi:Na+-translocating ferredoxin:NAD+ oxidoreductase subunit B